MKNQSSVTAKILAVVAVGWLMFTGRSAWGGGNPPQIPSNTPKSVLVGQAMDVLAEHIEEWGAMQMSTPLLVSATNFNFDLQRGATNYFVEAKTAVQSSDVTADQINQSLAIAAQANSAGATNPASVNATVNNSTNPVTPFFGLLTLANVSTPVLDNRTALNIAAGDQTTEAIFRLLGSPGMAVQFTGKQVMFGAVTVSINPGYRTRKGYAADLGVLTEYHYYEARPAVAKLLVQDTTLPQEVRAAVLASYNWTNLNDLTNLNCADLLPLMTNYLNYACDDCRRLKIDEWCRQIPEERIYTNNLDPVSPLVMSVSPLADIAVSDEASSLRDQNALALSLAGILQKAGLQAQASIFESYAHLKERDARSRTASATINTYSAAGGLFGWQVGPSFQAIDDPENAGPANVLERQTFPALIIVGFNSEDLAPLLDETADGFVRVMEPEIQFTRVPRWLPLKHHWWQSRFSESELLADSTNLAQMPKWIDNLKHDPAAGGAGKLAEYRLLALKYQMSGGFDAQPLLPQWMVPLPAKPQPAPFVSDIFPNPIQLEADTNGNPAQKVVTFDIVGGNLTSINTTNVRDIFNHFEVSTNPPGGQPAGKKSTSTILYLQGTVKTNGPIVLSLPWTLTNADGTTPQALVATNIVDVTFHSDTNGPQAVVQTILTHTSNTNDSSNFTVKFSPGVNSNELSQAISVIINEINKNKPMMVSNTVSPQTKTN